ncbi:permease [Paenibacillus crassostreae]|uniref:Permease n=1 Tax=Paenibacillus crassostreae TaxID=1763538 RepID=A0A167FHM8_9BACL|nr:permease [Paenibacillus crassostreae]AOZ94394.1 hypothetical protein LPB68_20765 [Paenibacillus crassostreae]OAB76569.1 hypothetical protein PNBC_03975 [Paenibacillus crassostreae]
MDSYKSLKKLHIGLLFIFGFMIVVAWKSGLFAILNVPENIALQSFKTMFISIVLESIPFILIGVVVSSILQIFVSEKWIQKLVPKNPLLGIIYACVLGILFPVCECGLIPIMRRLITKGMPLYVAVVSILVGPIVNPVVYVATFSAFRGRPEMLYARMGLAIAVGTVIGLIVYFFVHQNQLRNSKLTLYAGTNEGTTEHEQQHRKGNKIFAVLEHSGSEFFEMGKYLMLGSVITAAIQTFVPRAELVEIGQGPMVSHIFMMGFAYILSICSTSDAFVAASFVNSFSVGSLLTFLVFGPMLDFKSTLMLLSVFKTRFVLLLGCLIITVVLVGSLIVERFYFGY